MELTRTGKKIQLLQTLIDHPATGEGERAAARRMLDRVKARASAEGERLQPTGWTDARVYGAKYDSVRNEYDLAKIAKRIREDIKVARKVGIHSAGPGALAVADPIADAPVGI